MTRPPRAPASKSPRRERIACQFLIVLAGTQPLVWRRILVPERYTFWDLHVAVQDAMGWRDCHLHEFEVVGGDPREPPLRIGLPYEEFTDDRPTVPGWEVPIASVFRSGPMLVQYLYDFGDNWLHAVVYEGSARPKAGLKLPYCVAGGGRCPPEDCGGPPGYERFLETIGDPKHREHEEMLEWAGGSFDRDAFDPAEVKFDDPRARWRRAFLEGEDEED